jgi:hypothetical protein
LLVPLAAQPRLLVGCVQLAHDRHVTIITTIIIVTSHQHRGSDPPDAE